MGTNFFTMDGAHIGKRSAAGYYCFDCGVTLCKGGKKNVHKGASKWFKSCPLCGARQEREGDWGAAGLELGFNKNASENKTGVKSCSSFSWAIHPGKLINKRKVRDEYGKVYSIYVFITMIISYPIHFYDHIGKWFR